VHVRLPHRPALDGVRGLAVIAVMLFHANVAAVPGGFLGVDVFFVLSGFLITTLLVGEHQRTGRVDLVDFWLRRARRLLPALVVVLFAVAAYATLLAPDLTRSRLRGDALATLGYVANWRYIAHGTSYFERYSDPSPLLHTWSLAIEEQFYLAWPLLLIGLLWATRRRRGMALLAIVGMAVASAGLMAGLALASEPGADLSRLYYGTDTRAHALLVGAALAVWLQRRAEQGSEPLPFAAVRIGSLAGAAVLVAVMVTTPDTDRWMYHGGFLLVAVASAAVIAAAADDRTTLVSRALSVRPLRAVGVVSYGLYLWHWPVDIVLTPARTDLAEGWLLLTRFAVTGALAALSFVLVEAPVRRDERWRGIRLQVAGATVAAVCTVLAVVVATPTTPGISTALAAQPLPQPTAAPSESPRARPSAGATPSSAPTEQRPVRVFVVGDSVAYGMHATYRPQRSLGLRVEGLTQLGCALLPGDLRLGGRSLGRAPQCRDWPDKWPLALADDNPDVSLLMIGNGELFDRVVEGRTIRFGSEDYERFLTSTLDRYLRSLRPRGQRVVVTDVPCYAKVDTGLDNTADVVNDRSRHDRLNSLLAAWAKRHREVTLLHLDEPVCPDGKVIEQVDDQPFTKDGVHPTAAGSAYLWRWLAPRLKAAAAR